MDNNDKKLYRELKCWQKNWINFVLNALFLGNRAILDRVRDNLLQIASLFHLLQSVMSFVLFKNRN